MVRWVVISVGIWLVAGCVGLMFFNGVCKLNEKWEEGSERLLEQIRRNIYGRRKGRCMMDEEKTIRCMKCYEEFSDKETEGADCCPKCGNKGVPMAISQDVEVKINWHELRILTIWAENWAEAKCEQDSRDTLHAILDRLEKYRPKGGAALTLAREVQDLQEVYPEMALVRGDTVLVPPRKVGKA